MSAVKTRLSRFYPIVPDMPWLERIVPLGVETVQLRIKDAAEAEVRRQVREALDLTRRHRCQLIVNDYWKIAIEEGADYIHLGQEDLAAADIDAIRRAAVRFGISTHDNRELEIALAAKPDYVALGPVYETKLKAMRWAPQGLAKVTAWKAKIGAIPLVAIGGITPERAPGVIAAGADSVAVITDFVTHRDPEARIRTWLAWARRGDGAAHEAVGKVAPR
jgi:thiamine-phosphate pyrophosphorylase